MITDESVRLARMEARQEAEALANEEFRREVRGYFKSQGLHNDRFYETRDKVITMQARAEGAQWAATKVGALAGGLVAAAAWAASFFFGSGK